MFDLTTNTKNTHLKIHMFSLPLMSSYCVCFFIILLLNTWLFHHKKGLDYVINIKISKLNPSFETSYLNLVMLLKLFHCCYLCLFSDESIIITITIIHKDINSISKKIYSNLKHNFSIKSWHQSLKHFNLTFIMIIKHCDFR